MNASFSASTSARLPQNVAATSDRRVATAVSHQRREREFGVGYGSSSGYASPRGYVTTTSQRLFRFA